MLLVQGSASEVSHAESDSELNELSDMSDEAMLDAWQDMGSNLDGAADSMMDENMRGQHNSDILSDVGGILEADILLPPAEINMKAVEPLICETSILCTSWRSAAEKVLSGPAGESELQQVLDACKDAVAEAEVVQAIRTKLEKIKAWNADARASHSEGRTSSDVRALLEKCRDLHVDQRSVGREVELAETEELRSRMAAIVQANSSSTDLTDCQCDLRVCRALLIEGERLQLQFPEREQLKDAAAKAEVIQFSVPNMEILVTYLTGLAPASPASCPRAPPHAQRRGTGRSYASACRRWAG